MDATLRRPWWKRKRWHVAVTAWLLLPPAYLLSYGPVRYAEIRGWIPSTAPVYAPVALVALTPLDDTYQRYMEWWWLLAVKHEAGGLD